MCLQMRFKACNQNATAEGTACAQWIPPHERARAVSLATSGMYLGSAGAMAALPGLAAAWGAAALLRVVAALGFAWLALWTVVGRDVPYR